MRYTLSLLILVIVYALPVSAQRNSKVDQVPGRNSFYAELGGPGILFSANIDHRFSPSRLGWGGRAGIGFVTAEVEDNEPSNGYTSYHDASVLTIPLQVNYIFGKGSSPHTFEVGAGLTFLGRRIDLFGVDYHGRAGMVGTTSFMYRRQPVDGGFTWRIGFTPIITRGYIQPSAAVGVGYNF